jgi:hypothetical protein
MHKKGQLQLDLSYVGKETMKIHNDIIYKDAMKKITEHHGMEVSTPTVCQKVCIAFLSLHKQIQG